MAGSKVIETKTITGTLMQYQLKELILSIPEVIANLPQHGNVTVTTECVPRYDSLGHRTGEHINYTVVCGY
jgi:hypothetical protein